MNDNMNPKDTELAKLLEASAGNVNPSPAFIAHLEDRIRTAHKPQARWRLTDTRSIFSVIGWAGALVVLALVMTWAIRNLTPNPPQPAAGNTPANETPTPKSFIMEAATPVGQTYDWNGTQLVLNAPLPKSPGELTIYLAQPDQQTTLQSARALAAQLGMNGQAYLVPSEVPGVTGGNFLFVDGNQRLQVLSNHYFSYYPDSTRLVSSYNPVDYPNAEAIVRDFLTAKGFTSEYRIERTDITGSYLAISLTPEGFPVRYENFSASALTFQFDKDGLFSVSANLTSYAPANNQKYRIISAEEAFQKLFDQTATGGYLIGQSAGFQPLQNWVRPRRENETLTVWGWMSSYPSAENGTPLVSLDGYTTIGNVTDVAERTVNTFVEATGQFQTVNGAKVFSVESWKAYEGYEDGIFGALQRDGENVIIVSPDRGTFILPDVPADVPVPTENMYVTGVANGDVFEWKTLDNRPSHGGGGGGGGGYGFYKLNLSGTPVAFPTVQPTPISSNGFDYTVVAGDTCLSIAATFNVSADTLIAVNNLPADCSTLTIGQTIMIPYTTAMPTERLDGQRGILSITIWEQTDGSQRMQYSLVTSNPDFPYLILEGDGLESLQKYNSRPIDVWGTVETLSDTGMVVLNVERFEIPFPDLQFQILKGIEKSVQLEGQTVLLFTDESGKDYVEFAPDCYNIIGAESVVGTGQEGQPILLETLAVPDLTFGGYPAICVFSSSMALNPKTNQPMELTITADQPSILPEPPSIKPGDMPTLTIEKVELVYYVPDQHFLVPDPNRGPIYIQPAWRFYGHYSDGSVFEALIQALDPAFLLPETEDFTGPG